MIEGKVYSFGISVLRIGIVIVICLFSLQVYDRFMSTRTDRHLILVLRLFLVTSVLSVLLSYGLGRLRLALLRRSVEPPEHATWYARWMDASLCPIIVGSLFLLNTLCGLLGAICLCIAVTYSYWSRDALRCPRFFVRLLSAVLVSVIVAVICLWEALQGDISLGMVLCAACLSGWVFAIGLLQWHRPITDAEIF